MFVFLLISTERIAECIRQKLPYADVFLADSEEEIERNLTEVPPPIEFRRAVEIGGEEFQLSRPVGCFIRGAGTDISTCTMHEDYVHVHVHTQLRLAHVYIQYVTV